MDFSGKPKIAVLCSSGTWGIEAINAAIKNGVLGAKISVVVSDKKNPAARKKAKSLGIPFVFVDAGGFSSREEFDNAISACIEKKRADIVVCAIFRKLLGKKIVGKFRSRIINVHPSLLPAFPGIDKKVFPAVLESRQRFSGCTIHFVDEGMDTGKIIAQKKFSLSGKETLGSLRKKTEKACAEIVPAAINIVAKKIITQ